MNRGMHKLIIPATSDSIFAILRHHKNMLLQPGACILELSLNQGSTVMDFDLTEQTCPEICMRKDRQQVLLVRVRAASVCSCQMLSGTVLLAGNARWVDKGRRQCLVLWKKPEGWADTVYSLVRGLGMQESVMTVDELSSGDEVAGTGGPPTTQMSDRRPYDRCLCVGRPDKPKRCVGARKGIESL